MHQNYANINGLNICIIYKFYFFQIINVWIRGENRIILFRVPTNIFWFMKKLMIGLFKII